jgi:hypothetical protein
VGADATFSYKIPLEDQIKEIGNLTGGKFSRVFDASAMATETGITALATYNDPDEKHKYFATTNDWFVVLVTPLSSPPPIKLTKIGSQSRLRKVSRSRR